MSMTGGHVHVPTPEHVDTSALEASARHPHRTNFGQRGHRPRSRGIWRALTWPIHVALQLLTWPLRRALRAFLD
jgi:hypothetical protein